MILSASSTFVPPFYSTAYAPPTAADRNSPRWPMETGQRVSGGPLRQSTRSPYTGRIRAPTNGVAPAYPCWNRSTQMALKTLTTTRVLLDGELVEPAAHGTRTLINPATGARSEERRVGK